MVMAGSIETHGPAAGLGLVRGSVGYCMSKRNISRSVRLSERACADESERAVADGEE
jgi:hypothetical protein